MDPNNPALVWQQAPPPNAHATYAAERDRWGRVFLHYRCGICGDTSSKLCTNLARTGHWLGFYVQSHPPRPHAKT